MNKYLKFTFLFSVVAIVVSCATSTHKNSEYSWVHSTKSNQLFYQDKMKCVDYSKSQDYSYMADAYITCMKAYGWEQQSKSKSDQSRTDTDEGGKYTLSFEDRKHGSCLAYVLLLANMAEPNDLITKIYVRELYENIYRTAAKNQVGKENLEAAGGYYIDKIKKEVYSLEQLRQNCDELEITYDIDALYSEAPDQANGIHPKVAEWLERTIKVKYGCIEPIKLQKRDGKINQQKYVIMCGNESIKYTCNFTDKLYEGEDGLPYIIDVGGSFGACGIAECAVDADCGTKGQCIMLDGKYGRCLYF